MVAGIRKVEAALGDGIKRPAACESDVRTVARKSLVAAVNIPAGMVIERQMLATKRPGTGLLPGMLPVVIGRVAKVDIPADSLITWELLA